MGLPKLVDKDKNRNYSFENQLEGVNFVKYPSVTTILKVLDKPGLDRARGYLGNAEMDKRSAISTGKGTKLHSFIEGYFKGKTPAGIVDKEVSLAYQNFLTWIKVEEKRELDETIVYDFKTCKYGADVDSNYWLQLMAYAELVYLWRAELPEGFSSEVPLYTNHVRYAGTIDLVRHNPQVDAKPSVMLVMLPKDKLVDITDIEIARPYEESKFQAFKHLRNYYWYTYGV